MGGGKLSLQGAFMVVMAECDCHALESYLLPLSIAPSLAYRGNLARATFRGLETLKTMKS